MSVGIGEALPIASEAVGLGRGILLRSRAFLVLVVAVFSFQFANGINRSIQNNFFVEMLGLRADQMGLLTTAREIPGFLTAAVAALAMGLAPSQLGSLALVVMGIGYGAYGLVDSFPGLIAVAMVGSLGFHTWMPISNALGLALATRENAGQVLGKIQAIGFVASFLAMGLVILLVQVVGYRTGFFVSGAAIILGAVVILAYPRHLAEKPTQRLVLRRRYGLYYLLTFLDGCRGEVFLAFGVYLLVQQYKIGVETITALLFVSSVASMLLSAPIGRLIDRVGERRALTFSYSCHLVSFLGFALVQDATVAVVLYTIYNVVLLFSMATNTYLKRTASPEDVAPSLAMGMTTMHVSAMIIPVLGGLLWQRFGFQVPFFVGAVFIVISIFVSQRIPLRTRAVAAAAT